MGIVPLVTVAVDMQGFDTQTRLYTIIRSLIRYFRTRTMVQGFGHHMGSVFTDRPDSERHSLGTTCPDVCPGVRGLTLLSGGR